MGKGADIRECGECGQTVPRTEQLFRADPDDGLLFGKERLCGRCHQTGKAYLERLLWSGRKLSIAALAGLVERLEAGLEAQSRAEVLRSKADAMAGVAADVLRDTAMTSAMLNAIKNPGSVKFEAITGDQPQRTDHVEVSASPLMWVVARVTELEQRVAALHQAAEACASEVLRIDGVVADFGTWSERQCDTVSGLIQQCERLDQTSEEHHQSHATMEWVSQEIRASEQVTLGLINIAGDRFAKLESRLAELGGEVAALRRVKIEPVRCGLDGPVDIQVPPAGEHGRDTVINCVLHAVLECHDGSDLWAHSRRDPEAFRRAVRAALGW